MKCDGSPDPTILPDVNMYMSLWREDVENVDFDMVLKDSDLVLKVISAIIFIAFLIMFSILSFTVRV